MKCEHCGWDKHEALRYLMQLRRTVISVLRSVEHIMAGNKPPRDAITRDHYEWLLVTLDEEDFTKALEHYLECKRESDEAYMQFRADAADGLGASWEWYGRHWIARLDQAREGVTAAFRKAVLELKG